jgi:hypothetical protein
MVDTMYSRRRRRDPILTLTIIVVVLLVFAGLPATCGSFGNGNAPKNADAFAKSLNMTVVEVGDRDTDGDYYVSVTLRDADGKMVGAQCGTGYGWLCGATGTNRCKLDTAKRVGGYRGSSN